jgi:DNA polymerase (family 10)
MPVRNRVIADLLRRYGSVLALQGNDRFKVQAYRRAAETVETLPEEIATLLARGDDLKELPGIGKAISAMIEKIVRTGKLAELEKATSTLSPELNELAAKPGLDPKKVLRVYKKLQISSLAELKARLDSGTIREVLGDRMDFHIRQGLDDRPRMLLWSAQKVAGQIEANLQTITAISRIARVGSLRRLQDTVGDLNFLVTGDNPDKVFNEVAAFGAVRSAEQAGPRAMRFRLSSGFTFSVAWTAPDDWGMALLLLTGSAAHIADLRKRAPRRQLAEGQAALVGLDEAAIYKKLGLPFIEPELREGRGEVDAAAARKLPRLIRLDDLRGDLHMHTTASDGAHSPSEMAAAGKARGYEYIAITDHSQSLKITNGLTEKRLLAHIKAIDKLNARLKGFRILKSAEVDILEDGSLDYSASVLKELDFTICSIHSRFALNIQQQTERLLRAMDNPYFNILGHATGRLLLKREGYGVDMEKVMDHAKACGCFFEINASPDRLDLFDEHAKMAKERGIKIAINTDAHSTSELGFMTAGINQARRGWIEATDVLNVLPLARLTRTLRR